MSVVGNLSRHLNLAELAEPRDFPSFQSVATRQAEAKANLGLPVVVAGAAAEATKITDASVAHALNATFSDTEVEAALNALGVKINLIIDALEAANISASS
jgi:hypothetical protein